MSKAKNKSTTPESVQAAAPAAEQTQAELTNHVISLQDLRNILVVFDLASNRGAFKGGELEPIGQLYNKISKFIQAATPAAPVEESTTTTTTDTVSA